VRELQNVMERAAIISTTDELRLDLPSQTSETDLAEGHTAVTTGGGILTDEEIRNLERDNTLAALERTKWKVSGPEGAASLLGLKPTTLAYRMKTMGIASPPGASPAPRSTSP